MFLLNETEINTFVFKLYFGSLYNYIDQGNILENEKAVPSINRMAAAETGTTADHSALPVIFQKPT